MHHRLSVIPTTGSMVYDTEIITPPTIQFELWHVYHTLIAVHSISMKCNIYTFIVLLQKSVNHDHRKHRLPILTGKPGGSRCSKNSRSLLNCLNGAMTSRMLSNLHIQQVSITKHTFAASTDNKEMISYNDHNFLFTRCILLNTHNNNGSILHPTPLSRLSVFVA